MPMSNTIKAPPVPCGSCPYRKDVPSGLWETHEYDKLPSYDGPTWAQNPAVFMCHQKDGRLCGGWLACHDPQELLALRIARNIDRSVFGYQTDVPVFASGAAARTHGVRQIRKPDPRARKMMRGIIRRRHANGTEHKG